MNAKMLPGAVMVIVALIVLAFQSFSLTHAPSPKTVVVPDQPYLYRLGFYPQKMDGRWQVLETVNGDPVRLVPCLSQEDAQKCALHISLSASDLYGVPVTKMVREVPALTTARVTVGRTIVTGETQPIDDPAAGAMPGGNGINGWGVLIRVRR